MKLYELTNDFQRLFDSLEDMTENAELTAEEKAEAEKVWFDTLECVEAEFTDKAENVAAYVKVLSSEAKMLEAEEKALKARREQKVKQAESLKAYLMNSMQRVNLNKIEGVMAKISITKGRESTEITDPKAFVEWAKVNDDSLLKYKDPDISKTAVKAAIEAGREIPYAAVVRRPGLTIRYGGNENGTCDTCSRLFRKRQICFPEKFQRGRACTCERERKTASVPHTV